MHQIVSNRSPATRSAARRATRPAALAWALLLVAGCGSSEPPPAANEDVGNGAPAFETIEPLPPPPPIATLDDPLEGTWWVLAPGLPYMAFRANLVAPEPGSNALDGSWVSFDWRGSADTASLLQLSKPVAIRATRDSDTLLIEGAAPMLDANGNPNGHGGHWSLALRRASLPGEALRYSGRSRHDRLTGPDGTAVDFVREFRPWKKP